MSEIIPAVLPKSFKDLEAHLEQVKGVAKRVQVDIVDGVYAHSTTWPYHDAGSFAKIVSEEKGLPFWNELNYEFDLMINNPFERLKDYIHAGASRIIIHARSPGSVEALQKLVEFRGEGDAFAIKAGIALMCDAQPEELEQFEAQYDYIQVMGIARIGRQGEAFDKRALYLVERLRSRYPDLVLQVDGGVNLETAEALAKAGANFLIAGSAIFGADVPADAFRELQQKVHGN